MKKDFEGWELTAYALGELPSARSQVIESAIASDPAIAAELAEIRETLATVSTAYQVDSENGLSEQQKLSVVTAISDANAQSTTLKASHGWSRVQLLGLAATAACFIVAVSLSSWVAFQPMSGTNVAYLEKSPESFGNLPAPSTSPGSDSAASRDEYQLETEDDLELMAESASNSPSKNNELDKSESMESILAIDAPADFKSTEKDQEYFLDAGLNKSSFATQGTLTKPLEATSGPGKGVAQSSEGGAEFYAEGQGARPGLGGGGGGSGGLGGLAGGSPFDGSHVSGLSPSAASGPYPGKELTLGLSQSDSRKKDTSRSDTSGNFTQPYLSDSLEATDGLIRESKLEQEATRLSSASATGDRFAAVVDNAFRFVRQDPLSTFSIDVDTASYSKVRQYLMELGQLPPPDSVRIEELLNYFHYDYAGPTDDQPFASSLAVARCPWNAEHRLVRVAIQAKKIEAEKRPLSNLVFLLDVSGSMNEPNKLPLVQQALRMLISNLGENDRVAMVVYAGAAGMVLDSTLGTEQSAIMSALDRLTAGGSTNGGDGIQLAYQIAREHFITGGTNRVVLCTDGDFNVGVTGTDELVKLVEENAKSKIFLTVLGFGMGNTNDEMLEKISDRGNGVYGFIDNEMEARKLMIEQLTGSLVTVAKDVKIQVEFNPAKVQGYRLIGYENRILATEDFNNDKKDAGDIGAGHCVTALYEIIPAGDVAQELGASIDDLRYQADKELKPEAAASNELMIVKMRFKQPDGTTSVLQEFLLVDKDQAIQDCDRDFRWAASIAQFGMLLRNSPHRGESNWEALLETAQEAAGEQPDVYRQQALELINRAAAIAGKK
jgi:Ca-activated chloride channel homolog